MFAGATMEKGPGAARVAVEYKSPSALTWLAWTRMSPPVNAPRVTCPVIGT